MKNNQLFPDWKPQFSRPIDRCSDTILRNMVLDTMSHHRLSVTDVSPVFASVIRVLSAAGIRYRLDWGEVLSEGQF